METIREKAKREIGEWFIKTVKEEVAEKYKSARETFGMRAVDALALARFVAQSSVNKFIEDNFYGESPH